MATFVSVMLITGLLATVVQMRAAMRAQMLLSDMHQNTRFAMDTLGRDIRMADYGMDVPQPLLDEWVPWITDFDENPKIVDGSGDAPDEMTVVGAFGEPVAVLAAPASIGDETITLAPVGGFNLGDLDTYDDGRIFIGKSTTARITTVDAPNYDISIHPIRAMGLKYDYPAGTVIELVKTIEYERKDAVDHPWYVHLSRKDTSENTTRAYQTVLAGYIEGFQVQELGDSWEVNLTGIVSRPDRFYTHPDEADHFRRETLTSVISKRN